MNAILNGCMLRAGPHPCLPSPKDKLLIPVTILRTIPTILVQAEFVDWGTARLSNHDPKFDFRARIFTR
ncbi:MAG: hypothetical protein M1527_05210 [Gammaproteobacteria bacterium]|nr:hypothetical protein [Gammaproteobacteria bacterium]